MADQNIPQPAPPKPDYYMSAEFTGINDSYTKGSNYTLEVWEHNDPQGITAKDLKGVGEEISYLTMKEFTEDWKHVTQLFNYKP